MDIDEPVDPDAPMDGSDRPIPPPPVRNPREVGYLGVDGNWHPIGWFDDQNRFHYGQAPPYVPPQQPEQPPRRPPKDDYGTHRGDWVTPNATFRDVTGRTHQVHQDSLGVFWMLSDYQTGGGQRQAQITVDQWNHQFQEDLQPDDDSDIEMDTSAPQMMAQEFREQIERERARKRLRAKHKNDRDTPLPIYTPPQIDSRALVIPPGSETSGDKRKRLERLESLGKKLNLDESPASFQELEQHRVMSKRFKPGDIFRHYIEIPGKRVRDPDAIPQGFPGTENRIERHTFNPVLNVGPANTVSSYTEAVANGPLSVAAWRHDIAYDSADTEQDVRDADTRFLAELLMIPEIQRDTFWHIAYNAIAAGSGRIWWKLYPRH